MPETQDRSTGFDELIARLDKKIDEQNRQEHRAHRMIILGILALLTTVFLTVTGGMFTALNSKRDTNSAKLDANTAKIDKPADKIDALDAKVERILGILQGRDTQ